MVATWHSFWGGTIKASSSRELRGPQRRRHRRCHCCRLNFHREAAAPGRPWHQGGVVSRDGGGERRERGGEVPHRGDRCGRAPFGQQQAPIIVALPGVEGSVEGGGGVLILGDIRHEEKEEEGGEGGGEAGE